jgi:hypothetical protein
MQTRRAREPDVGLPRNIDRTRSYFDILERLVNGVIAVSTTSESSRRPALTRGSKATGGETINEPPTSTPTRRSAKRS